MVTNTSIAVYLIERLKSEKIEDKGLVRSLGAKFIDMDNLRTIEKEHFLTALYLALHFGYDHSLKRAAYREISKEYEDRIERILNEFRNSQQTKTLRTS